MTDTKDLIEKLNEDNWLVYVEEISKKLKPKIQKNGVLKLIREKVDEDYKDRVEALYSKFISEESTINLDNQIKNLTDDNKIADFMIKEFWTKVGLKDFYKYIDYPDYIFKNIMEHGQTLNKLAGKIINHMDELYDKELVTNVIVQGDTTTAFTIALSAFHRQIKIIHLEAGLRTNNKNSPFPEELNRRMISQLSDVHLCPTKISINNLQNEKITKNVYLVGNTIVDMYKVPLK